MVSAMSTDRMRELETLLARIRAAKNVLLNYDMWDSQGASHAPDEVRARWEADAASARSQLSTTQAELEKQVATTRASAPGEIAAWADAHDQYLAAFLAECAAKGASADTAASVASEERAGWHEVRDGKRAFVDENVFYVTLNAERYRTLFGVDP